MIRALAALGHEQRVVHTGQHYDERMSEIFFVQLGLPRPDVNLGVGSGTQARQTAEVMVGMEQEFTRTPPALAVRVRRRELDDRGRRSPGPSSASRSRTSRRGCAASTTPCPRRSTGGSPTSCATCCSSRPPRRSGTWRAKGGPPARALRRQPDDRHAAGEPGQVRRGGRACARTVSGTGGTSSPPCTGRRTSTRLIAPGSSCSALHEVAAELDVIIPLHPRGRATLAAAGLLDAPRIRVIDPLGYLEFMSLVRGASAVVTDSGGVQEETTLLRVPCLTLRPNTERPITVTSGSNRLITSDELAAAVLKAVRRRPVRRRAPAAVGRPRRAADRPGHHDVAEGGMTDMTPRAPRWRPDGTRRAGDARQARRRRPVRRRRDGRGTRAARPPAPRHPDAAGHDPGPAVGARTVGHDAVRPHGRERRAPPLAARRAAAEGPVPAVARARHARRAAPPTPRPRWRPRSSPTWPGPGSGSCPR